MMKDEKNTPKHSVGKGPQKAKYNTEDEAGSVNHAENEKPIDSEGEDNYLEQKWNKISKDFQQKYNVEVSESKYKDDSFSEVLKNLENKTGKTRATLEQEIKDWKNS